MRQTLCAMITSTTAAVVILASSHPFASAAPQLPSSPAADLQGSYIPEVSKVADGRGSRDGAASRAPVSAKASSAPPHSAPRSAGVNPQKSVPEVTQVAKPAEASEMAPDARPTSSASRRRQPTIKPSAPIDVPKAKPLPIQPVAPGSPARALRPAPPPIPGGEVALDPDSESDLDDSGVGTGDDAPRPLPEDAGPRFSESFRPSPSSAADDANQTTPQRLSPQMVRLREQVRSALGFYHQKHLNIRDHDPWEVMHSIVAYGGASQLDRVQPRGEPVNAICWMCWNGDCKGIHILDIQDGRVAARRGPNVQGHPGQFLAILAQSRVDPSCPMRVEGQDFTLADLIESEKLGCRPKTELTFKLISLAYYLEIDETWTSSDGQDWSIDRLVKEELAQPIVGAACGGTHRLMGLAYAVRKREMSGLPVTGEFARARKFLDDYHRYTFKLQNSDGSFSTEWFKGPGARPDLARRIQTSGHILEWLSYSLPVDQLDQPRVVKAVTYLSGVLHRGKSENWSVGPLGHALHALAIYDDRYFRQFDPPVDEDEFVDSELVIPTGGESLVDGQPNKTPDEQATSAANSDAQVEDAPAATEDKASANQPEQAAAPTSGSRIQRINPADPVAPSRPGAR